jgi:ubiquinone/menaquinone biosynthesis C-methylase UbiE
MDSIRFDRIASQYDATRAYPPGVVEAAAASLAWRLPPGALLLEVGTGTGRILLPFRAHKLRLVGLDISRPMLARLVGNIAESPDRIGAPPPLLVQCDAAALPLPSAFDAVLGVNIFHLIAAWQSAIQEARRVLKPGGALVLGYEWKPDDSAPARLRERWESEIRSLGWKPNRKMESYTDLPAALLASGAAVQEWTGAEWTTTRSLEDEIGRIASRSLSYTWDIPDSIFDASLGELRAWAREVLGPGETPCATSRRFCWQAYRWD